MTLFTREAPETVSVDKQFEANTVDEQGSVYTNKLVILDWLSGSDNEN